MKNKKGKSFRPQQGITFLGVLVLLVLVGFIVYLGVRIIPVYMNEYKITSTFDEMQKDPKLRAASPHLLRDRLERHFEVNSVRYVRARDAKFRRLDTGGILMSLSYRVSRPLFGNIGLSFTFKPKVRLEAH
jgi:hypothetical protein